MDEFLNAVLLQYFVPNSFTHTPHIESEQDYTE
jgi:hypothetical protein